MTQHIYALRDPLTGAVRYVGCCTDPKQRLANHIYAWCMNYRLSEWIKSLRAQGARPEMVILETFQCETKDERLSLERRWIESLIEKGHDLFNVQNGGDKKERPHTQVAGRV